MPTIGNYAGKTVAAAKQEASDDAMRLKIVTADGTLRDPEPDEEQVTISSNGVGYEAGKQVETNAEVGVNLPTP